MRLITKLMLTLMLLASSTATARDMEINISAMSDYRFRGISQTQGRPAFQGQVEYQHDSGAWMGTRLVNVSRDMYVAGRSFETDFYGGYMHDFGNGYRIYVGDYQYVYPRAYDAHNGRYDTNEVFMQLRAGPVTMKLYHSLTDYFSLPRSAGTNYASVDYYLPIRDNITLVAHGGYTMVANHSHLNYADLRIGVAYEIKPVTFSANIYDNEGGRGFRTFNTIDGYRAYGRALVVTASFAF